MGIVDQRFRIVEDFHSLLPYGYSVVLNAAHRVMPH